MLYGQLTTGLNVATPMSWPSGTCKAIGFFCDNGLAGEPPASLRVAYRVGGTDPYFVVSTVTVDSTKGKTVVHFGTNAPKVDAVSVQRLDGGTYAVSWDAS